MISAIRSFFHSAYDTLHSILYLIILTGLFLISIICIVSPESILISIAQIYRQVIEFVYPHFNPMNTVTAGIILLITSCIGFVLLLIKIKYLQATTVLKFSNPNVEVKVSAIEKALTESLNIFSGVQKAKVKLHLNQLTKTIKCQVYLTVEEGVHLGQIEKGTNALLRKRTREILLGISVNIVVKTKIKVNPEVTYVPYQVISDASIAQPANINGNNSHNTNFPEIKITNQPTSTTGKFFD